MTCCLAVGGTTVAVSSIDVDKCFVCSLLDTGNVRNLTESFGETYDRMPINNHDLQKACAAFSADGKLFAYNTNKGKLLSVWNTVDWSLAENKTLAKHATNLVFTPKTNAIVVGDKKGDVYSMGEPNVRVLGHSSMVLDVCFSKDEKYIVTCDSDEKVRVSHYPNGKIILYYMMGHEAYVSGVCMLNDFVLSGSGDRTLRLWNASDGNLLDKLALPAAIQSVVGIERMAAVHLHDSNKVYVIKTRNDGDKWNIKIIETIELESNVLNVAAHGNQLWVLAGHSVCNYSVDSINETVVRNEDVEMSKIHETLHNIAKSFVCLENTNLMIYLYKKMIDKQKRIEQCGNNYSSVPPCVKKIKTN